MRQQLRTKAIVLGHGLIYVDLSIIDMCVQEAICDCLTRITTVGCYFVIS